MWFLVYCNLGIRYVLKFKSYSLGYRTTKKDLDTPNLT